MYICVCHAVTEKEVRKAIASGVSSVARLSEQTRLGTQCGCCTNQAEEIIAQSSQV